MHGQPPPVRPWARRSAAAIDTAGQRARRSASSELGRMAHRPRSPKIPAFASSRVATIWRLVAVSGSRWAIEAMDGTGCCGSSVTRSKSGGRSMEYPSPGIVWVFQSAVFVMLPAGVAGFVVAAEPPLGSGETADGDGEWSGDGESPARASRQPPTPRRTGAPRAVARARIRSRCADDKGAATGQEFSRVPQRSDR